MASLARLSAGWWGAAGVLSPDFAPFRFTVHTSVFSQIRVNQFAHIAMQAVDFVVLLLVWVIFTTAFSRTEWVNVKIVQNLAY
jgi:hypothetical protein